MYRADSFCVDRSRERGRPVGFLSASHCRQYKPPSASQPWCLLGLFHIYLWIGYGERKVEEEHPRPVPVLVEDGRREEGLGEVGDAVDGEALHGGNLRGLALKEQ